MSTKKVFMILTLTLAATLMLAGDAVRWINVTVHDTTDGADVKVHVPLSLASAVIKNVKTEGFNEGRIKIEMDKTDVDLAAIFKEIKAAPDGEYVTVKDKDADVKVLKKNGMILIDVQEKGEKGKKGDKVKVRIPVKLLDSIQVTGEKELDINGVLSALAQAGTGEIVTVESDDANVKVWIE